MPWRPASGGAILAPLAGAVKVFSDMGGDMEDLSARTGMSVGALSELSFAAKQTGTEMGAVEGGAQKMQKFISEAAEGSKSARETIADLGFTLEELKGMTPDQQMIQIGKKIASIEDPAKRAAMMMTLFGKSGTRLLPMMNDIDALAARARELGLTLNGEDTAAADAFGDKMDELWAVLKRGTFAVGAALVPSLDSLLSILVSGTAAAVKFIDENRGLVTMVAGIGAGLLAGGAGAVILGQSLSFVGSLGGMVVGVIGTLLSTAASIGGVVATGVGAVLSLGAPVLLVAGAVGALAAGILYFTGLGSQIISGVGGAFTSVKEGALAAFGTIKADGAAAFEGISGALADGNIGLAVEILWSTLKLEWQRGVSALTEIWEGFKGWFFSAGMLVFTEAGKFINNAWAGVETVFDETVFALQGIWEGFTSFVTRTWNSTIGFIAKAWVRLKSMFSDIDVKAEIAKIDADTQSKNGSSLQSQEERAAERAARKKDRDEQLERDRAGANTEFDRAFQESLNEIDKTSAAALQAAEADLESMKKEWQTAVDKGKNLEADRAQAEWDLFGGPLKKSPTTADLDSSASKVSVTSTFDASIASRLGAVSPVQERAAKAAEDTAKKTGEVKDEVVEVKKAIKELKPLGVE